MEDSAPPNTPAPPQNENSWGMACHLVALIGYVIPLGSIIGPLVIWMMKKEEMPFVEDQGKESLNFNISIAIYAIVCLLLIFVVIGGILMIALMIFHLVFTIMAAIKASKGESFRYPLTLRLVK